MKKIDESQYCITDKITMGQRVIVLKQNTQEVFEDCCEIALRHGYKIEAIDFCGSTHRAIFVKGE